MYPIAKIAELTHGKTSNLPVDHVTGLAPLSDAVDGQISFYNNIKYLDDFRKTDASVVIVKENEEIPTEFSAGLIEVRDVAEAMATLMVALAPKKHFEPGIGEHSTVRSGVHMSVSIGRLCSIGSDCKIGAESIIQDSVYIGDNVTLGTGCHVYPGVRILDGTQIGDNCIIHANTVIGADGFGFAPDAEGNMQKIPQLGNVIIGNAVEIGANCVIDRGSIKDTVIKDGVKLDNLIQIAHNVEIGEHTVIAAQVGIAGSTTIGKYCMIGGQAGIVGHLKIADGTKIQAQSGMIKSVPKPNTAWYGYPAIDYQQYMRAFATFKNLPELAKNVRELEKKLSSLHSDSEK